MAIEQYKSANNEPPEAELNTAIELLKTLVSFDTTSRNSNLELINWCETYLSQFGAKFWRIPSDDKNKANLIAQFGPDKSGGIVLSGHSDVVPVDDQIWDTNPWQLSQSGGKLFGRGTCDMKGFSACVLALAPLIASVELSKPIYYALSYDEEVGCLGAPRMIDYLAQNFPKIDACIVGEPTDMKTVSAHKGITSYIVEITGREAHSSRIDMGVSAIMAAIPIINLISEMGASLATEESIFTPSGTTLTIGTIQGGTAVNILAHHCKFVFDIRFEPDLDIAKIVGQISECVAKIDADIKLRAPEGGAKLIKRSFSPGLQFDNNSEAEQISRNINGDNDIIAVAYAAEAGLFQSRNIPTIICGPGSILQAHQPNEFVEIIQISKCISYLKKIIARQCQN